MKEKNVLKIYTENTKDFAQAEGIVAINPVTRIHDTDKLQQEKMRELWNNKEDEGLK